MGVRSWWARNRRRLATRALDRQLEYQRDLAETFAETGDVVPPPSAQKRAAADELLSHVALRDGDRVLEIGPGARGLLYYLPDAAFRIGADPLALAYRFFFPAWTRGARTCAAAGEDLPFRDGLFDVVICDNVVDHAEDPARILREAARVLKPGGTFYFTVNVHHSIYGLASAAHALWNALGLHLEIGPFADHTVHLTAGAARRMCAALPLQVVHARDGIAETRRRDKQQALRHPGDLVKRLFYKNARFVLIARKSS